MCRYEDSIFREIDVVVSVTNNDGIIISKIINDVESYDYGVEKGMILEDIIKNSSLKYLPKKDGIYSGKIKSNKSFCLGSLGYHPCHILLLTNNFKPKNYEV